MAKHPTPNRRRSSFAYGALAALLAVPAAARAQSEVTDTNVDRAATANDATAGTTPGDIIVTAQRRSENIQKVPVAITALDPVALDRAGATNVVDLRGLVPGLITIPSAGSSNSAAIYIRGMGQDGSTIFDEPGVAIYTDGVYLGRTIGSLFDLIGVERIEVLRGPQGTLYGRNSTSGAIKVVTKRPSTEAFSAMGDVTLGSFHRADVRAFVNIPLGEDLAATVSASSINNDGYYHNRMTGAHYNGKGTETVRAGVQWKGDSPLSVYVTADYARDRSGLQVPTEMQGPNPPKNGIPLSGDFFSSNPNVPDVNRYDGGGTSLEVNYDLGSGSLQAISAYRRFNYHINLDENGTPNGLDLLRHTRQNQISQELQYVGSIGERLKFVLGGFFFREKSYEGILFQFSGADLFTYESRQKATSYAAFAQADYKPLDWLTFTLGGRYSIDKKVATRIQPFVTQGDKTYRKFTPKVGVNAQALPNLLLYASYSKGYKAGVFQPFPGSPTDANVTLKPEQTVAYEVGFKSDLLDHHLRANVALYDNKYTNLQLGVVSSNGAVGVVAADLRSRGIEVELTATPFDGLQLYSNFAIMDTKFTKLPPPGNGLPVAGDHQKFTPPFSGKAGIDYTFPIIHDDTLTVGAALTWEERNFQQYPNYLFPSEPYQLVDARAEYNRAGGKWGVEVAVKNITNKLYYNYSSQLAGFERYYQPKRTFYVRLKYAL